MKILQIISHYVPAYGFGGPLQVAHSLAKALVDRGHTVTVCCTSQMNQQEDMDIPLDTPQNVDGVEVYYEPIALSRKWGYSPAMRRRLPKLLEQVDAVIIHNHFQYAGWVGAQSARRAGKPYVTFAHASLKRDSLAASNGLIKRLYLRLMEHGNLTQANHIAFNASEELKDSLYSENGIVLPNGISLDDFNELPERGAYRAKHPKLAGRTVFLTLGRIDIRQKAVDLIIEAFALFVKEHPNALLVLAGSSEGEDLKIVKELIRERGIEDWVFFPGLVKGQDKLELLRDADVFLMPSRYEGLSIALLEGMASGLPVILSDRAGLHTKVAAEECGLIVQPSVESILLALGQMMDEAARSQYGESARRVVLSEHTWGAIAEKMETILESCQTETL
ncbi:glycosyltransferase [bacterium]|nr:glycosyltransferase [bacterium]